MSCFATFFPTNSPACSAKVSWTNDPSFTMWVRRFRKYDANINSTEQDTLPIVFLISKQVVSYQTRGGTCCHGVSTPKSWSLVDSSTTCHDSNNHLHHFDHCSNHIIDPHHSHLISQRMEDHNILTKTQAKLNITKDGRLVQHSRLQG
jgi:hypothetical protein